MKTLIYFEGKKIVKRRSAWAAFLLLLLAVAAMAWLLISGQYYFSPEGYELSGLAAAAVEKEAKHPLAGQLTPEVLAQVLQHHHEIYGDADNYADGWLDDRVYVKEILPYRDILNLMMEVYCPDDYELSSLTNVGLEDAAGLYVARSSYIRTVLDTGDYTPAEKAAITKLESGVAEDFTYDYYKGWSTLLKQAFPDVFLLVALAVCIVVSPIFANEYQTGGAALILSSKYGRKETVVAKIIAGTLVTTMFYVASALLCAGAILFILGTQGWNCDFQLLSFYSFYGLKLWQVFVLGLGLNYLVMLAVMAFTMLVSALCSASFGAVVISVLCTAAPLFLPVNQVGGTLRCLVILLPARAMDTVSVLDSYEVYSIGSLVLTLPAMIVVLSIAAIVVMLPIARRLFCNRQVV